MLNLRLAFVLACVAAAGSVGNAADWPQWMGPERNGIWNEKGVVRSIPEDGLPVKWRLPIAGGYAGPAVANGKVYVCDYVARSGDLQYNAGAVDKRTGKERVLCVDSRTGEIVWSHEYDCNYEVSFGNGPRVTPTVDGDRVYTIGAMGHLFCFNAATGEIIWQRQVASDYGTKAPYWGVSAHPLVDGDKLICLVGGEGSAVVAFDKNTGKELWKSLSAADPGYCPPTIVEAGGARQLVIWLPETINGLNPETGEVYWSQPLKPDYNMSIMSPRKEGNYLFASGIGNVGALFELATDKPDAKVVWRGKSNTALYAANSTPIIEDGVIYGCDCRPGALRAVRLEDGERLWETYSPTTGGRRAGHGTAFLVKNSDLYYLFSETGDLVLAKLSPEKYEEVGRFHVLEPTSDAFGRSVVWSHPAFANRHLFARNDKELVCVSLEEQ